LPLTIPRSYWGQLAKLTLFNMVLWHCLIIIAIPTLSSGRAAILGYTMPIFSAVFGSLFFKDRLGARLGRRGAAALGVLLLLWHEVGAWAASPWA
jgi:drug/metabolite transporter (DMT)-like permease